MKIDNISQYPGVEAHGVFSNATNPVKTPNGSIAFLVSNYAGLYGVAISAVANHAALLFVTDNYSFAAQQHAALGMAVKEG